MTNPNVTIIPLSFDVAFLKIERGDLLEMSVIVGEGNEAKATGPLELSDAERDQLVAALMKPRVDVDDDELSGTTTVP
jgi:hypothetical protein